MHLDRLDRLLLNAVQADASLTSDQLAEIVPLSPSAIQRRLRRLKAAGVIVGTTILLDPRKVGRPSFFLVSLRVERERPELLATLRKWLGACEQVQQAYYVTGDTDFVLVVTAADAEEFDRLMSRLMAENPNVHRFTTNVALSLVKRGLAIPLAADDT